MNSKLFKTFLPAILILAGAFQGLRAQGPPMPPGGNPPGMPIGGPGPVVNAPGSPAGIGQNVYNPGPPPPAPAPSPRSNTIGSLSPIVVNSALSSPDWQNQGTTTVIACGYDAQGVWRTIPLRVSYNYNGAQYNVTVNSAWNPWTDMWNYGVDVPAFNTYYFLNGNYYDFYVNLSTGTWYFNL